VPLPLGAVGPDFFLPRTSQETLALRSLNGDLVVLAFYPMDWEPVSREQLALYQNFADEFRNYGAHLPGISIDHAYSHDAFARDAHIHFRLLADFRPRGATARQYGVYRSRLGVRARTLFVLDGSTLSVSAKHILIHSIQALTMCSPG
jgi:peroxiredoxin